MGAGGCAADDRFLARVELDFSLVSSVSWQKYRGKLVVRQRASEYDRFRGACNLLSETRPL